jgi:hypothetical protein
MYCGVLHAEGGSCPDGFYPIGGSGAQGCAPIAGYGDSSPRDNEPRWESRWIAFAVDDKDGVFGVGKDQPSKRAAEGKAMMQCSERGGHACRVFGATHDQCLALASGTKYINSYGSPNLADAENFALEECGKYTMNCKIYYSACSYPGRIR